MTFIRKIIIYALIILFLFPYSYIKNAKSNNFDSAFSIMDEYFIDQKEENNDPFEKFNRTIFKFNEFSNEYFLQYIVKIYDFIMPEFLKTGVNNVITNIQKPLVLTNSLLQGKANNATAVFSSFLINSTIGIFGIFDIASDKEIFYQQLNIDSSLSHYGIPRGPYIMLPLLGPSTIRGVFSLTLNSFAGYYFYDFIFHKESDFIKVKNSIEYHILKNIAHLNNISFAIDGIRQTSMDPYITIKNYYLLLSPK